MTISANFREALFAQETDDGALVLITIDHDEMVEPIRVVLNTENIVSRGNTFQAYPFRYVRPEYSGDRPPKAKIEIDNVDQQIMEGVRTVRTPMSVLIETVSMNDPDTVEESLDGFELINVVGTVATVSGDLSLEDLVTAPYPYGRFTPGAFRGGF